VNDSAIYKSYREISPHAIIFHGSLSLNEDNKTKSLILEQLSSILPTDGSATEILEKLNQKYLTGNHK
jgi:hypothetical protein